MSVMSFLDLTEQLVALLGPAAAGYGLVLAQGCRRQRCKNSVCSGPGKGAGHHQLLRWRQMRGNWSGWSFAEKSAELDDKLSEVEEKRVCCRFALRRPIRRDVNFFKRARNGFRQPDIRRDDVFRRGNFSKRNTGAKLEERPTAQRISSIIPLR
ncbi:hypothetical protein LAD77_00925 [Klebsiella pneumoniae]|nr:hypothetical protein [Klebsiella pneumoniae]